jgi:cardiolipin synthase
VNGLGIVDVSWLPGLNAQPAAIGIFLVYLGVICSVITTCIYTYQGICIRRDALGRKRTEAEGSCR